MLPQLTQEIARQHTEDLVRTAEQARRLSSSNGHGSAGTHWSPGHATALVLRRLADRLDGSSPAPSPCGDGSP